MKNFVLLMLFFAFSCAAASAQSSGGIKGKVRVADGDGISGVSVTARKKSEDVKSATTDSSGKFTLEGLKSGTYTLVFNKSGYSSGLLYNVEVKNNKTKDLGDRLILTIDQGTQVIVKGSVFDQDGRSISGAKIEVEKISSEGATKKLGSNIASYSGEFTFRFPEGAAKLRITASAKGVKESKEIEVDNAAIYRLAIILNLKN